jgi:hypothetical protein
MIPLTMASWTAGALLLQLASAQYLSYNGLNLAPQMGWDTYNAYGLDYNGTTITTNAERLISLGFRDLGYNVIICTSTSPSLPVMET